MHRTMQSSVLTLHHHEIQRPEEINWAPFQKDIAEQMTGGTEFQHPRVRRKAVVGTCCVVTTACVKTDPDAKCIFHDCATSKGYESCMECQHWSNPAEPCHLDKVSRNYCPAILRHRDLTL